LDVLQNQQLLKILECVLAGSAGYGEALDRLQWLVWPKWIALAAWYVLLAPEQIRERVAVRIAANAGIGGAVACVVAVSERGVAAEVMALCIAVGMVALVPACFRKRPAVSP